MQNFLFYAEEVTEPQLPAPLPLQTLFIKRLAFIAGEVEDGRVSPTLWYSTPPPGSGAVLSLILNILKGKLKLQFIVEQRINSKCKLKCYVKSMKNPLGVSPSKGNQGTTRSKEKIILTSVGIEPTTSGLDLPLLCTPTKLRGQTEKVGDDLGSKSR